MSLKTGDNEAEVLKRGGTPRQVIRNADGSRVLEFSTQPNPGPTYMVRLSPQGGVLGVEQVLTEANFQRIIPGMRRQEVERILGVPASIKPHMSSSELVWEWRVVSPVRGFFESYRVYVREGIVTRTDNLMTADPFYGGN